VKLEIVHSTRYRYSGPIAETVMEVRLRPMDGNGQRCVDFKLELSHGVKARAYVDGFGNHVHYFNLVRPHSGLTVSSRSTVETGLGPDTEPGEQLVHDFIRFRSPVKEVDGVRELARRHAIADLASPESVEHALDELTLTISREFTYDRTVTNVYSSVDDVLELRAGVPGLRAPVHSRRARDGRAGALRERLHPLPGREDQHGVACVGRGMGGGTGMDRVRCDPSGADHAAPCAPCGGTGLHRCGADARRVRGFSDRIDGDQRQDPLALRGSQLADLHEFPVPIVHPVDGHHG